MTYSKKVENSHMTLALTLQIEGEFGI